jgi:hypothetical protein
MPIRKIDSTLIFFLSLILFSCNSSNNNRRKFFEEEDISQNDIIERNAYEFNLLKDPSTGKIPAGITEKAYLQGKNLPEKAQLTSVQNLNTYTPVGPDNLGGRTRAFAYDVRYNGTTNQVMIAGSVSSGVMRSNNGGASWSGVAGTTNIHDITCVAQDPRPGFQDTWYLGTGEASGNSSSGNGAFRLGSGLYKSTDNGVTWAKLANSNPGTYESFDRVEDLITRVIVNPVNGDVYMACVSTIKRSANGGSTWATVLSASASSSADMTDIVCTTSGILYAGFAGSTTIAAGDGVWTSSTGASGSWTHIAGNGTPAGWKASASYGRIVLALAPSNQNILYAAYDNKLTGIDCDFFEYDASATTWSANRSANLPDDAFGKFSTQGGYDLAIGVKPDDPNFVILGGTNAYTSSDGFATLGNYNKIGGYSTVNHHPDIHTFSFEPGSNIKMVSGDDGGIQRTPNVAAGSVTWTPLNNGYQTFQYYYVTIDPTLGSTKYIGGAQDNGTTYRNAGTNTMLQVLGGDGVSVGISSGNTYHYVGSQSGDFYRRQAGDPVNTGFPLKPAAESNKGLFVTLFYLDPDNTENLYYANNNRLWRTISASTVLSTTTGVNGWNQMTGTSTAITGNITSFAATRGTYDAAHNLYIGTDGAKIFRLKDPRNTATATVPDNITPAGITAGSTVIGIAVAPQNDDTVMAVISNYGAASVFWTGNATAATPLWYNIEGTSAGKLDLPSFRSCAIVGTSSGFEYYVGTSVGLFSAAAIDGTSQATANNTSWVREGTNVIDESVVTSLAVRNIDNTLLVGTHGNGMFVANILSALPVTLTSVDARKSGTKVDVDWSVSSENNVTAYVIERKYQDESLFTQVGTVQAAFAGTTLKNYNFVDNNPSFNSGTILYRLKIIDNDNRISYSKIVSVKGNVNNFITSVYPTIVHDKLNISVSQSLNVKTFKISIVGINGETFLNKEYEFKNTTIPTTNYPAGAYVLTITNGKDRYTSKFIKQ